MKALYNISAELRSVLNTIAESDGEVTPEIEASLAISQAELEQKGVNYALAIREMDGRGEIIDQEIERLKKLKKATETISDRLKNNIKAAMVEFGVEKVESNLVKLSLRKSKETVIDDESLLPESCFKTERKVVKAEVKKLIESGAPVAGARIVENKSLQIK